jgi:hypothetical protein
MEEFNMYEMYIINKKRFNRKILNDPNLSVQLESYETLADISSKIDNLFSNAREADKEKVKIDYEDITKQLSEKKSGINTLQTNVEELITNLESTVQQSEAYVGEFTEGTDEYKTAKKLYDYSTALMTAYATLNDKVKLLDKMQNLQEIEINIYKPIKPKPTTR